jgi:hypothetical protein
MAKLTKKLASKIGMSYDSLKAGILSGTIKGIKLSDRVYMIDDSLVPVDNSAVTEYEEKPEVNTAIVQAKEAAEIAEQNTRKAKAEIEKSLLEQGYKNVEEAKADVNKKSKEADALLASAIAKDTEVNVKLADVELQISKAINALRIVKQREDAMKIREEESAKIEQSLRDMSDHITDQQEDLKALFSYHDKNIKPVITLLRNCLKSIDAILNYSRYSGQYKPEELSVMLLPHQRYLMRMADKLERFVNGIKPNSP